MGIFTSLRNRTRQIIGASNATNLTTNTSNLNSKISTVWKLSKDYYSYGGSFLEGTKLPQQNEVVQLTNKNFLYSLFVTDAKSEQLISPNSLQFEIIYSNVISDYKTYKTIDSFNIEYYSLLSDYSIHTTVRIRGDDYVTAYVQLGSETTSDEIFQSVSMVNINNLPDGVSVIKQILQQNNNGIAQEYVLDFPASDTRPESATITISQGAKFYDKNNNLLVGPLLITTGYFSSINPVSYYLFSPGWDVPNLEKNGELIGAGHNFFNFGGFYNIEVVDENGTYAERVSL